MMDLIEDRGLGDELQDVMISETGNTHHFLGSDSEMDEESDCDDPEAALRRESADQQALVTAVAGALESRRVLTDLERSRMQLEDLRGQQLRNWRP